MSKKHRQLFVYTSPIVGLVIVLLMVAKFQVDRLQSGAEQLAGTGRAAIQLFKEFATGIHDLDSERILATYAEDYESPSEGSWSEELRSDRDGIRVYDWRSEDPRPHRKPDVAAKLDRLLQGFASVELSKLKLNRVEEIVSDREAVVRSFLWLRGERKDGEIFETQVQFRMWIDDHDGGWKIRRQEMLRGLTVTGSGTGFGDFADSAGLDFSARRNPLFATPEWRPERFGIIKYGSAGVSAADYDGDGWYDLYFADGASSRLYKNTGADSPEASFRDVTSAVGLPTDVPGINLALFLDLDNDGDKDLFLGRFMEGSQLYRNDGVGADGEVVYTDVTSTANLGRNFVVVATAADYDLDGDLDLYLGRYLDPRVNLPTTLFYTRNGEGNSLLRNDGDLRFTDVTAETGVRDGGLTLGVAWGDYDEDGDPDLYVANDFGRNALLRNEIVGAGTERFTDVTESAGALDFGFGMSASWGDVDNDGDLDLYVSNVHSGQRWYGQAATLYQYLLTSIKQGTIDEDYHLYKEIFGYAGADWRDYGDGMVKGNSLLLNAGDGTFTDIAETAGVNPFGWYWASAFFDYDNDGLQDIYAANGWISGKTTDDL